MTSTSNVKVVRPRRLTEEETLTTFADWKNNLEFFLQQGSDFQKFLKPDSAWSKRSDGTEHRGLTSDAEA